MQKEIAKLISYLKEEERRCRDAAENDLKEEYYQGVHEHRAYAFFCKFIAEKLDNILEGKENEFNAG